MECLSTSPTFTEAIGRKRRVLLRKILVTTFLLNFLEDAELLTIDNAAQIMGGCCTTSSTNDFRVNKLLDILETRDDTLFPRFLAALRADKQEHVVKILLLSALPCADVLPPFGYDIVLSDHSNASTRPRCVKKTAHVLIQTQVEQQTAMTQTGVSYSDHFAKFEDGEIQTHASVLFDSGPFEFMPLEVLELVLMRTLTKLFSDHYKSQYKTHEAVQSAYSLLADVCYNWWLAMKGWPQSPTKHWFMHKTRRLIQSIIQPYSLWPYKQSSLNMWSVICGVAWCDNKVFVVYHESNSICVFGPNNKQLLSIKLEEMKAPCDIVVCYETQQLYVAGESRDARCVWRVSLDGKLVVRWLPNKSTTSSQLSPWSLSVSSRRLLVVSKNAELYLYGADGVELRRIPLPKGELLHAVETSRGTFIVSYRQPNPQISEFNIDGHIIREYGGDLELSCRPNYLSMDSYGRVFVTDTYNDRILLLNAESLEVDRRVLLDAEHDALARHPHRVHYVEQTGQLLVASSNKNCLQLFRVQYKSRGKCPDVCTLTEIRPYATQHDQARPAQPPTDILTHPVPIHPPASSSPSNCLTDTARLLQSGRRSKGRKLHCAVM